MRRRALLWCTGNVRSRMGGDVCEMCVSVVVLFESKSIDFFFCPFILWFL